MGPRRSTLVLALLALGLLVASAGTAVASSGGGWSGDKSSGGPSTPADDKVPGTDAWSDHAHDEARHDEARHHEAQGRGHDVNGPSNRDAADGVDTSGGVTGTSVDFPSAPVQAPAATASGPAPDAVAPALIDLSVLAAFAPASAVTGPDLAAAVDDGGAAPAIAVPAVAAPDIAAAVTDLAPPTDAPALAGVPGLGSVGALASGVPDAPATARALLTTRTGRPLAVFLALVAAIVLFLAVHRRVDGSDPRLTAHTGPDVARFR